MQNDPDFQALDVALVSIALDDAAEQAAAAQQLGIEVPMLVDDNSEVSKAYDVLKWAVASGEPSHTFVLVGEDGKIKWIRDYGAPNKADRTMYVPVDELVAEVKSNLGQ